MHIVHLFDTPEYLITTLSNVKLNLQGFLADLSFRILTKIGHVLMAYIKYLNQQVIKVCF